MAGVDGCSDIPHMWVAAGGRHGWGCGSFFNELLNRFGSNGGCF